MEPCNLCQQNNLLQILHLGDHPIAHHFLISKSQSEYVHPVIVCFCESCGLIQLSNHVPPEKLYTEYVCLSSWKHHPHASRLVTLIDQLPRVDKTSLIIEVGCNDGNFLGLLHERGYRKTLGIEPAQDAYAVARQRGLETWNVYFTQEEAHKILKMHGQCDLLIARQVLEHVTDLAEFRKAMQLLLKPGGYVLIEVPNFEFSLTAPDYSAIWEEHVNHFTKQTLNLFMAEAGIRLIYSETAVFSGEALIAVGEYVEQPGAFLLPEYSQEYQKKVMAYRDNWPGFRKTFIEYLQDHQKRGGKVAVYGAGCRACSLINYIGLGPFIEFVVDDQPEKQGKYMPGSRLPILPGNSLEEHQVDLCLLAVNAENEKKVMNSYLSFQAKGGKFASMLPPSDRLLPFWSRFRYLED
jgi:2-polyprenyl-3-methyl-5-hydroxy-6-metoxy-1,4-benzoquinol methylase